MRRLPGENLRRIIVFFTSNCLLKILSLKTFIKDKEFCSQDISSTVHGEFLEKSYLFLDIVLCEFSYLKIVSEYDQEIPQSQTADNPVTPRGRAAQPSRDTRKTN